MGFDETPRFWYPTFPFAPTKTYGLISVDLKKKRRKEKIKISLSLRSLSQKMPFPFFFDFLSFYYYYLILLLLLLLLLSIFIYLFYCFIFPIISSTSHLIQYKSFTQVHHMSCHVSPDTRCLKKREILTPSAMLCNLSQLKGMEFSRSRKTYLSRDPFGMKS